ncbi:hypothetical protein J5O05_11340 [Pseudoalteromonas xiamenensis]|uniref:Secreted protein n=2 Tax=Pseudoalteromonas xiamenensis TaxID=882626 RepID=A0A975HM89_9GAMM|nr:hypothetical protein [Pseudoalteromonas xiamenensis]QTH72896.1 hypothetical protein J5O05_11340 [Pseudoalteromonas xiamenensis]
MMIRLKTRTLLVATFITASVGVVSFDGQDETLLADASCGCQQTSKMNQAVCQKQVGSEWINWLTGNSGSAQFHYLDLLELLLGGDKSTKNTSIPGL